MIKHSFVRSSKMPRATFTSSCQPSPKKTYYTEQNLKKRRQSPDYDGRIQSKENQNDDFLKSLLEQSLQHSKVVPQFNTKENEINSLRSQLFGLQNKMKSSKIIQQKRTMTQKRMTQSSIPHNNKNEFGQTKTSCIPFNQKKSIFKVMDSASEQSQQPQSIECDTIALREMSKGIHVLKQHSVTKQYLQEYLSNKLQPFKKVEQLETSLNTLSNEIKQMKKRQINIVQLIQKYNQSNIKQLSSLKSNIKFQMQELIKYQITKNNQIFFKFKNNDKTIIDIVNKRIEEQKKQTESRCTDLEDIFAQLQGQSYKRLQFVQQQIQLLRQQMQGVIDNALEQFNSNLQQLKSQQTQLAGISQSIMDIVKCLVKKTGQVKQQKPTDLIEILKSSIIDINQLKIQQSAMSKQLSKLKSPSAYPSYLNKQKLSCLKYIAQSKSISSHTQSS